VGARRYVVENGPGAVSLYLVAAAVTKRSFLPTAEHLPRRVPGVRLATPIVAQVRRR